MDKNAIKKYAVWARRELIERVSQRALLYGISADAQADANAVIVNGQALDAVQQKQRKALIEHIREKGYEQVMEEVAYTWFNRFAALRFMEVNGYLPSHIRVFTDDDGAFRPQILTEAIHLDLDGLDMDKVYALERDNKKEELFKYLLIVQCNALSGILPGMFQKIEDYTELLLPDYLLREGSVIEQMVSMIPEEDWTDQVQIIGWLYQYYNTEPKDQVFADLKKNIKISKEKIPAATQLFTPDWIVHYMVENSLGRLWIEGHPDSAASLLPSEEEQAAYAAGERTPGDTKWHYYLEEAPQEADVEAQLKEIRKEYAALKPEEILCIDPCMGSGHILCVLFDVLVRIYEDYGYTAREAAVSIVQNNLWGLDIDTRAAQLAYFAVMMKARQYDRRFFSRRIQPHVYAITESNHVSADAVEYFCNGDAKLERAMQTIIAELHDAKEYGSILTPTPQDWNALYARFDEIRDEINIYKDAALTLEPLVQTAQALGQKYWVTVTNPPYRGVGDLTADFNKYVKVNFPDSKADLFSVFIERCKAATRGNGLMSMITRQAWMFQSSFLNLRMKFANSKLTSLLHLGSHAFDDLNGEVVQAVSFVFQMCYCHNYLSACVDATEPDNSESKQKSYLDKDKEYHFNINKIDSLPGKQYAYWISDAVECVFQKAQALSQVGRSRRGLQTGNASLYIRLWYEINAEDLTLPQDFVDKYHVRWVLENNGGPVRKWYNSIMNAVLWDHNGHEIKNCSSSIIPSEDLYFSECITWNKLTTKGLALKYQQPGIIPGDLSPFFLTDDHRDFYYCFGLLNSCVAPFMMRALNPTITTPTGDVSEFPVILDYRAYDAIEKIVSNCVQISRRDSASFEDSWEFARHPLMPEYNQVCNGEPSMISESFDIWSNECQKRYYNLKDDEQRLNHIFCEIYGLEKELEVDVDEKEITIRLADVVRDIKSLISYAVGCMFGRYSIDEEGLVYAGGTWDASKYKTFPADKDAIIPICDDEYFTDDIVGLFVKFVEIVYGAETLEENLRFIADALGTKGSTSREIIRNYFLIDFYKDHLKTYQKRPIYWLFDSGKKNGFKCLIYMHRYRPDTIARIRTDYVHEQQSRYRTAIADLEQRVNNASASERVKLNKQLQKLQGQSEEVRVYEEKIHHLADQFIPIDLDDGVKVNYAKFQDVLAKIK